MSDPRKPIDNGRSWKAEFLPGSPGEKAIESLGLRPDHLRHDLVAFDEQIESLAAEITRLRARLAASNADRDTWKRCCEDAHYRMILARRALAFGDNTPLKPIADEIARAATDAIEKEKA